MKKISLNISSAIIKVLKWIWFSSANPQKVSDTIQFAFAGALPSIMVALHILNIPIPQDQLQSAISQIEANAVLLLQMVGYGGAIFFGARKIWLSIKVLITIVESWIKIMQVPPTTPTISA
jgi:hypothetical protein